MPDSITTVDTTATDQEIKRLTDRDGGVIVTGVLSPGLVARMNEELDPHLFGQEAPAGYSEDPERASFYGRRTRRIQSVAARSDAAVEAMLDERILTWVASCLTWCTEVSMNSAQVIDIGPGEPAQVLHRDEELWPELVAVAPGDFTVSCMIALTDFTEATGATRIVPGSSRRPKTDPSTYSAADTVAAVMSAGDVLFFTGEVVHGGGANTTSDRWRRGLALSYVVGWLRTEEAHNLAISLERARQLPPRLRELLCFAGYRAPMGMVYQLDMADPYVALFDEPRPEQLLFRT